MDNIKRIGERIAAVRKSRFITQEELIERIGEENMSLSTLKRVESGRGITNMSNLIRICTALNYPTSDIFSDDKRLLLEEIYNSEPDDKKYVNDILMYQKLYYPEVPDYSVLQRRKIHNMLQLLIYLPLMNRYVLQDCLLRIEGDAFGREDYVSDKLDILYRSIPEGEAKEYADMMAKRCTAEYVMEYHTSEITEYDAQFFDESTIPKLEKMRKAYLVAIEQML